MSTLNVGKTLRLPLEVATQATTITGLRGSGKSHTAAVIIEELLENKIPVLVIDPTDVWYGLLSSKDGKKEGHSVAVFGGDHGHMPVTQFDGKSVAEFCVAERVPVVLSIRHLRKGEQRRLVAELFTELYHLKGKPENRTPLTVVIDEAPLFVPQLAHRGGDEAAVVGAVEDLVNRGRSAGFGVIMISQRSATINKNVFDMAEMMIVHRSTSPRDRRAFMEWIEENADIDQVKDVLSSLSSLKDGEAWIWAPKLGIFERAQIRERYTYDSSRTPKIGEIIAPPKKFADVDKEALAAKFAANLEVAKRNDPVELKKQIKALEAELAKKQAPAMDQTAVNKLLDEAKERVIQDCRDWAARQAKDVSDLVLQKFALPPVVDKPKPITDGLADKVVPIKYLPIPMQQSPTKPVRTQALDETGEVTAAHVRIYAAVNWWLAADITPTFVDVATVAGLSLSGYFNRLRQESVKMGFLDKGQPGRLTLGERAMSYVPIDLKHDARALLQHVKTLVDDGTKAKMLSAFDDDPLRTISFEDLARESGLSLGGYFNRLRQELVRSGYLQKAGSGSLQLSDMIRQLATRF